MSRIVASPATVFAAVFALVLALFGGMLVSGLAGPGFGPHSGEAAPAPLLTAYAHVTGTGEITRSRGGVRVQKVTGATNSNQYCFDLEFVPKVAVASAFWSNGAWVSTATKADNFNTGCEAPFDDAAAQVFADPLPNAKDVGFKIVFHR